MLVDSISRNYQGDVGAGCQDGAGGMEKWTFKATRKGTDTIAMVYARAEHLEEGVLDSIPDRLYVVTVE